ncbi:aldo/keto reductase [Streptomyces sp. IB2014 016-6]|uniref:aldo/keto reductase n=1 Tax=Streptomyces sp. IB2014 016-6 TaxID=2517818 RepID=UPI001F4F8630|nr:aldo/keto reductase [Streptomyces sp. IB2014 016-6]
MWCTRCRSATARSCAPRARGAVLDDGPITSIAAKHGRSPARIVLRRHLRTGNVVIPKSVTGARIREKLDVFDFELDQRDIDAISPLDRCTRTGPDPDAVNGRTGAPLNYVRTAGDPC